MNRISPQLRGEIERSFGSVDDMIRALQHAQIRTRGIVYLGAMRDGSLQISSDGHSQGVVIYSSRENWNTTLLSARYREHMERRALYPMD